MYTSKESKLWNFHLDTRDSDGNRPTLPRIHKNSLLQSNIQQGCVTSVLDMSQRHTGFNFDKLF